jgi:hypothetical protein
MVPVTQKELERHYLNEARAASSIFPTSEPLADDPLDFVFPHEGIGIEVSELCRPDERGEGKRLGYVAPRAKKLYLSRPDAQPVSVSPVFTRDAHQLKVPELAASLAQFVYDHRAANRSFEWHDGLPPGYLHIGVFPRHAIEPPDGEWRYFRAGDTVLAPKALLDERIAEKNRRLDEYRRKAPEIWLLLVNDLFLGPGEVALRADDIAQWSFPSKFDRLLVFQRQPGGSGVVSELRQH